MKTLTDKQVNKLREAKQSIDSAILNAFSHDSSEDEGGDMDREYQVDWHLANALDLVGEVIDYE